MRGQYFSDLSKPQTAPLCVRIIAPMRPVFVGTLALGVIVALFGAIWALQGFGVLQGSPMSNTTTWSIIGPITAVIGVVVAVASWRKPSRR